jgi:hypothetical protein
VDEVYLYPQLLSISDEQRLCYWFASSISTTLYNAFSIIIQHPHPFFKTSSNTQSTTPTIAIMVSFRTIFTSALALSVTAAQSTPAQVVSNIQMITQKSQALQRPAQSISIVNGPLIVIGQGPFPQLIVGFTDIVSTATTAIAQMQGMARVPAGADADKIFEAFREVSFFTCVLPTLLTSLIVCPCPPGPPQHLDRQIRIVHHHSLHRSAHRCRAPPGREHCRRKFHARAPKALLQVLNEDLLIFQTDHCIRVDRHRSVPRFRPPEPGRLSRHDSCHLH